MKKLLILFLTFSCMMNIASAEEIVILGGETATQEVVVGETFAQTEELEITIDAFTHSAPAGNYTHQDVTVAVSLQNWSFDTFDAVEITDFEVRYGNFRYPAVCMSGESVPVEMLMNKTIFYSVRVPDALLYAEEAEEAEFVLIVDGMEYVLRAAQCAVFESKSRKVAANGGSFALVKADGTLWTWGLNSEGELGDGTTEDRSTPRQVLDQVVSVWAGQGHMMALREDGTLWTWGKNYCGQLGDGTTNDRSTPRQVLDNVVDAAAGSSYSVALRADGTLWTWGYNRYGQLGDGTTNNRSTPAQVMENVAAVSAGDSHTLAVCKDGALWAWGLNDNRQLGDRANGNSSNPVWAQADVLDADGGFRDSVFIDEAGSLYWLSGGSKIKEGVVDADVGAYHILIVDAERRLWAYGDEIHGGLGNGGSYEERLGTPTVILENVVSFNAGGHSSIAITEDGSVYTWGWNGAGNDENGAVVNANVPVRQTIKFN